MGFQILPKNPIFLRQVSRCQTLVRHLSVGKGAESHLLPRLYVGPQSESAVSLQHFLSNNQQARNSPPLKEGVVHQLSTDQSHYVSSVMRMLGPGRKKGRWTFGGQDPCCRIFDGHEEWVVQLEALGEISKRRRGKQDVQVLAKCLAPLPSSSSSQAGLIPVLCFAPPKKKDRYQWILEKSTELGMQAWLLLRTDRTESSSNRDYERKGQAYVLEAAEQCERQTIPPLLALDNANEDANTELSALSELTGLLEMIARQKDDATISLLICRERSSTSLAMMEALRQIQAKSGENGAPCTCLVLIGPEGGWSPREEETFDVLCREHPEIVRNVSLGSNVLRTDTAAVAAMAAFAFADDAST